MLTGHRVDERADERARARRSLPSTRVDQGPHQDHQADPRPGGLLMLSRLMTNDGETVINGPDHRTKRGGLRAINKPHVTRI